MRTRWMRACKARITPWSERVGQCTRAMAGVYEADRGVYEADGSVYAVAREACCVDARS